MPLPALGLKGPWAAYKAGPRRTIRIHARHALVTGTAARLASLLRALLACCVPCTLTAAKGVMPLPALGLKGPRAA